MDKAMRVYFRELGASIPGAALLAVLTASVTLTMAVILSSVTGSYSEKAREANRCRDAQIVEMLRGDLSEEQYPPINIDGIDCERYIVSPFRGV